MYCQNKFFLYILLHGREYYIITYMCLKAEKITKTRVILLYVSLIEFRFYFISSSFEFALFTIDSSNKFNRYISKLEKVFISVSRKFDLITFTSHFYNFFAVLRSQNYLISAAASAPLFPLFWFRLQLRHRLQSCIAI